MLKVLTAETPAKKRPSSDDRCVYIGVHVYDKESVCVCTVYDREREREHKGFALCMNIMPLVFINSQ